MSNRTTVFVDEKPNVSAGDGRHLLSALLEQSVEPLVLFDASGMVLAANQAMIDLHAAPSSLVGSHLERLFSFNENLSIDALIRNLGDNAPVAVNCSSTSLQPAQFPWRIEFDVFQERDAQAVVLGKVTLDRPEQTPPQRRKRDDVTFSLTTNATYEVLDRSNGRAKPSLGRCHQVFFEHASPCEGCPLAKQASAAGQVISSSIWDETVGAFRLVTVRTDAKRNDVQERWISEQETAILIAARIDRLAVRARATRRERVVLELLILGRSLEEIATVIGITVHTVKFHQANLLKKMGADSRVDLLRLLL